jgi:sugar transferase (PEP-CTERM/EpsH1 system associated)
VNILYLAHRIPYPPNKGDKLRAFRHIKYLSRRHRVWCACFVDDAADARGVKKLKEICVDVAAVRLNRWVATGKGLWGLARGGALTKAFYHHAAMRSGLAALWRQARFDVVLAFSSSMAEYALTVPAARHVLDLCDCDSEKWTAYSQYASFATSWLYRLEGRRLAVRERVWANVFDATMVVTESEASTLRPFIEPSRLFVVGNGVDRSPAPFKREGWGEGQGKDLRPPTVGFVGVMNYFPNVDAVCWFADQCWPAIRAQAPGTEFRVIGRSPTGRVRQLARRAGITVVGEVESVAHELRQCDVSIAPLRIARGVQNKVLEAMAAAKPVVLTGKVAASIRAADGHDCIVADTPDRVIQAVTRLLLDPIERARIGENGRHFVMSNFRWEDQLRRLEAVVTGQRTRSINVQAISLPGRPAVFREPESEPRPGGGLGRRGVSATDTRRFRSVL